MVRDIGFGAILVATVGVFDVIKRRRWDHGAFLALVGIGNIVAVAIVSKLDHAVGFYTGILSGGLLIDVFVVLAVLTAGATRLAEDIARRVADGRGYSEPGFFTDARVRAGIVTVVVLAVIAPSLVVHFRYADHHGPALADRYANRVFDGLPTAASC